MTRMHYRGGREALGYCVGALCSTLFGGAITSALLGVETIYRLNK